MSALSIQEVSIVRAGRTLVEDVSLSLQTGQLTALLGPNGAGKTTLLQAAAGIEKPTRGQISIADRPLQSLSAIQRARQLAYLPQTRSLAWPVRVRDVVALGRYAYGVSAPRLPPQDTEAVSRAIAACDLEHLADRRCNSLSGGELARMHCARALASEAPMLIADEPTAALDPRHALDTMTLLKDFVQSGGTALVVLHDLALAARHADRLIWMQSGRILADGSVTDTLTEARLAEVFGVRASVQGQRVSIEGPA